MNDSMQLHVCYICEEEDGGTVFRVCQCDNWIHERCFWKLVTQVESHRTRCSVCLYEYRTRVACNMKKWPKVATFAFMTGAWGVITVDTFYHSFPPPMMFYMFSFLTSYCFHQLSRAVRGTMTRVPRCARYQTRIMWCETESV